MGELGNLVEVGKETNRLIKRTNVIITITNLVNIATIIIIVWAVLKQW